MHLLRFIIVFLTAVLLSSNAAWGMNPKIRAIGLNAVYGSVGGALLGVSSLALGAKGRVVAKGASLGLYFGLAFGIYVVMTHERGYGEGSGGGHVPYDNTGLYDDGSELFRHDAHPLERGRERPDFYFRLFQYQF